MFAAVGTGFEARLHGATKWIGGHGTTIAAVIVDSGKFDRTCNGKFPSFIFPSQGYRGLQFSPTFGLAAFAVKLRVELMCDIGPALNPFGAKFLLIQGVETQLACSATLRQRAFSGEVQYLLPHVVIKMGIQPCARVSRQVSYPGLERHAYHEEAKRLLRPGTFGGVLSFGIKGDIHVASRVIDTLKLASNLANVGDAKTLVIHPTSTTHLELGAGGDECDGGLDSGVLHRSFASESIQDKDVVIVGGGPVGLALASAIGFNPLVRESLNVALIDAGDLSKIRDWSLPHDTFSNLPRGEMARLAENLNLQRGFLRHLDKLESIQVLQKLKVKSIQPEVDSNGWPLVHLSDGTTIRARLLVGADGFSSPVRSYAGISSYGWSYDTQAVVATLNRAPRGAFERPDHIAYQRFLPTGPIAFLPLSHRLLSNVLASMINAAFRLPEVSIRYLHDRILEAEAAGATLSHDAIKDEIAFRERSNNISKYPAYALPSLRLPSQAGTIASFPLRYNHTEAYLGEGAGSRTVLIGDAAHTIHPLAGQGLDLGLGDVECLARCIDQTLKHGGDIGSYTALRPYASERYFANHKVMSAVDKLHKLYSSTVEPIISKGMFAPSSRSGSSEPISEDTIYQAPPQNKGSALFPSLLVSLPSYPLSASRDVEGVFLMLGLIAGGNKSVTIFITVLRLIIPQVCSLNISPQEEWFKDIQKDRGRAVYGLKEKNLAKAYIKLIPLGMKDPDASRLLNWKRPSGKFVESKRSSVVEGSLSVDDLNGILDELSKNIGKQDVQSKILQRIYNRSTAEEQKWMVRIILKDMVISVKEITVFSVFHPDAEDLLNTCSDLKKVAWELSDPTRRLKAEDKAIQLLRAFAPMLCKRPKNRIEESVEEIQGHAAMSIFAVLGKDYIGLYGKYVGEGSLTPHIDAAFDERVEEIILDGEMLVWDPVSERKFPFGTLKTAALDKSKAEHNPRLCFKVFDLLYLNGMSLHNKSLKFRKRNLHAWIQEISGRIEFMVEFEGKTAKDVRQRMGEVMAARGEGLILKHPDSVYTLNGRNKDWIKVKPEYMDDLGETVDVLVVGTNSGKLWN
ncbi:hypothetical protein JVU11DRAFT_9151 [Chiua virens]|nr:hypothetical protein JVU11DRAFT_9151 [Chiua virens]